MTDINKADDKESGGNDTNGKEKEEQQEQEIIVSKSAFPKLKFDHKTRKEMLYGLIVIFMIIAVYTAGQIQAIMMIEYVNNFCGNTSVRVVSASPFDLQLQHATGQDLFHNATPVSLGNGSLYP